MDVSQVRMLLDNEAFDNELGFFCPECSCIEDDQYTCGFCEGCGRTKDIDAKFIIKDLLSIIDGKSADWSVSKVEELLEENCFNDHIISVYDEDYNIDIDKNESGYVEVSFRDVFEALFTAIKNISK